MPRIARVVTALAAVIALAAATATILRDPSPPPAPPLSIELAAVTNGSLPFDPLATAREGDWCALVSTSPTRMLQCYAVRRAGDAVQLDHMLVHEDGRRSTPDHLPRFDASHPPGIVDLLGLGDRVRPHVSITNATCTRESRRVGARSFACARVDAEVVTAGSSMPPIKLTLWLSPEVKAVGLVAARTDSQVWELAGSGNGSIATFGDPLAQLESAFPPEPR
jgi:hypothetical protein